MQLSEQQRAAVAEEIAAYVRAGGVGARSTPAAPPAVPAAPPAANGSAPSAAVAAAVARARAAQGQLRAIGEDVRRAAVESVRAAGRAQAEALARLAHDETRLGRYADKVTMAVTAAARTPGVEHLVAQVASLEGSYSRSRYSPYGVIASILPMTVPNEAVVSHTIAMVSGGNSVVFMPHPHAEASTGAAVKLCDEALTSAGLPPGTVGMVEGSSIEAAKALMQSDEVDLLVVTGGAAVVAQALRAPVRSICGGPGNTPVLIDATADLRAAAGCVARGVSFDNTIGCVQEKEVFVQQELAPEFLLQLESHGAYLASDAEIDAIAHAVLEDIPPPGQPAKVKRDFVGVDAGRILAEIGVGGHEDTRLIACRTDATHPFVATEMLMPVLAVCPTSGWAETLDRAVEAEHGYRHSAVVHSRSLDSLEACEDALDVTMLIRNSPSFAAVGVGSAMPFAITLATRTGESSTTVRSFVRTHWVTDAAGAEGQDLR